MNIEKIKIWLNSLSANDFETVTAPLITGYNTPENVFKAEKIGKAKKLKVLDTSKIKVGDYFIVDSIYSQKGDLCLCQKIKGKRHHKIIEVLAKKSQFNNFSWGFFEVPVFD